MVIKRLLRVIKRLLRRIHWLLFIQWEDLRLRDWPCESCKRCGKCFRLMWNVEDNYWRKVFGDPDGGVLCLDCFLALAKKKGVVIPTSSITVEPFRCHEPGEE